MKESAGEVPVVFAGILLPKVEGVVWARVHENGDLCEGASGKSSVN